VTIQEAIDNQLERLDTLNREWGDWIPQEYASLLSPLHEALLKLAEKDLTYRQSGV